MIKYILLLCLALAPAAWADEAAHRAAATQCVDVSDVPASMRYAFMAALNPMIDGMKKQGMPDAAIEEMKQAVTSWYDQEIKWEDLKPQVVDVYVKEFTEEELNDMVKFYQSPAGKKALAKMPVIMQQSAQLGQAYFQTKQPSLNERIRPVIEKYRDKK